MEQLKAMAGRAIALASAVLLLAGAEAMRGRSLAQERMTEEKATKALLHGDAAQRHEAAAFALELGAAASLELKKALLHAAWREARNRSPGEAFITYSFAVADMMDTIAIPYLLEVMKHGPIITNSLADYGRTALGPVLDIVTNSSADYDDVDPALETLRFMIEDGWMSEEERAVIEEIAWKRTTVPGQHWFVVGTSIQLALALDTPKFRRRVEELAFDLSALRAVAVVRTALRENGDMGPGLGATTCPRVLGGGAHDAAAEGEAAVGQASRPFAR